MKEKKLKKRENKRQEKRKKKKESQANAQKKHNKPTHFGFWFSLCSFSLLSLSFPQSLLEN